MNYLRFTNRRLIPALACFLLSSNLAPLATASHVGDHEEHPELHILWEGEPLFEHDHDEEVGLFRVGGRWSGTNNAANFTGARGDAITLTYGVVPDGTAINGTPIATESTGPSDLVAFLNTHIGSSTVWQPLIDQSYGRWGELSGLTFVHETNDDSATMGSLGATGVTGVRADMRIGGRFLDGQSGSNVLAYNYFPSNGDQVIDTSNISFYSNSANNYRALRNVLMHEAGHGLGFNHFESSNSSGLMEPSINLTFDGPQHDDILAVQRNYGDALEANGGNDTLSTATPFATFASTLGPQTQSIGTDADDNTFFVAPAEIDFVSIDGTSDTDIFSFTLLGSIAFDVSIILDPKGPTYLEGGQGGPQSSLNTKALSDLELELLDAGGSVLDAANLGPAGVAETLIAQLAPGDYFIRVAAAAGADDDVQLYQLDLTASLVPEPSSMIVLAIGGLIALRRRRR